MSRIRYFTRAFLTPISCTSPHIALFRNWMTFAGVISAKVRCFSCSMSKSSWDIWVSSSFRRSLVCSVMMPCSIAAIRLREYFVLNPFSFDMKICTSKSSSNFWGAYHIFNKFNKGSLIAFYKSKLFWSSKKLMSPIVTMPSSSVWGRILSFTTTIFLKESPTFISERFSCRSFSSVGIS